MATYDDATVIPAEGSRVGFLTCMECGAALLVDPRSDVDVKALHDGFHGSDTPFSLPPNPDRPNPTRITYGPFGTYGTPPRSGSSTDG